ncbi:MAG: hypothetical protein QXM08_03645 [Thermofilaceae archaeon]
MTEAIEVFKERIIAVLDEMAEKKPPARPGGVMYLQHLKNRVKSESAIGVSDLIEALANAGYSMEDIILFFYKIGVVSSHDDIVRLRDAVRRILAKRTLEE